MSELRQRIPEPFEDLYSPARYKIYYGGRGGAKSWQLADALLIKGFQDKKRILCARELQNSIEESVHRLLSDRIEALGLTSHYQVQKQDIQGANGTKFFFAGVKNNPTKIKSMEAIDYCWLEEADKVSDNSWDIIIPTIRSEGSEIWASFNTGHKFDPTCQRFIENPPPEYVDGKKYAVIKKVSWRDNPWFPEELKREMLLMKEHDYEKYLHIWEGEYRVLAEGAIYGKQMRQVREEKRILNIPIQPSLEVDTFWDLGKNDHTAIWFMQKVGLEYHFIDYYENRLQDLDHYIKIIKEKEYNYGTHYLPHDVEFELLGMKQNRKEQLINGGVKPITVVPRIQHINEGIEMTRQKFPSCYFDESKCEKGIEALANYRYQYNEDRDAYNQTPYHDWASNGADAFRMFAQGFNPQSSDWTKLEKQGGIRERHKKSSWDEQISHIV